MKNIILFLFLFQSTLFFSQKKSNDCKFTYTVRQDSIIIKFTNNGRCNLKIPKSLNYIIFDVRNIEYFNENSKSFVKLHGNFKDIDCFGSCNGKLIKLKKGKSYDYKLSLKKILEFNNFINIGNYKFRLFAHILDFHEECEFFETDLIDYQKKN